MATALDVVDRVREILNDNATAYRYADATLWDYITLAQREVLKYKPEANARVANFTFASTNARQRLNAALYYRILRVDANIDTSLGNAVGSAIRTVERDLFDTFYTMWPVSTVAGANGSRYKVSVMDASDPLAFWIFPRPVLGEGVQITAVPIPAEIVNSASALTLNDMYIPALADFVCHMCMRSEEHAESEANAATYHQSFLAYLGQARRTVRAASNDAPAPPEARE